jgi:hypothetical protein
MQKNAKSLSELLDQKNQDLKKELKEFYAVLGEAFSIWGGVELAVYRLFILALDCRFESTASAAYHSIGSFRGKLNATDATITVRFGKTRFYDQWVKLHKTIRKKSDIRNELAHWAVGTDMSAESGQRINMSPDFSDIRKSPRHTGKPRSKIYLSDILKAGKDFTDLKINLMNLQEEIEYTYNLIPDNLRGTLFENTSPEALEDPIFGPTHIVSCSFTI